MNLPRIAGLLLLSLGLSSPAFAQQRPGPKAPVKPQVEASPSGSLTLKYDADVGYAKPDEDAQPVGPDFLSAGPAGRIAVYDVVRKEVVVADQGEGVVGRFEVGRVDGLLVNLKGDVMVMNGGTQSMSVHSASGELIETIELPSHEGMKGQLLLEGGVIYAVSDTGSRRALFELVGGRPMPIAKDVEETPFKPKDGKVRWAGEEIELPPGTSISGQPLGGKVPWVEVEAAKTGADGSVEVERFALRKDSTNKVPLPIAEAGYRPSFDVAVDPGGTLVYLDPQANALKVVWVEAP